MRPLFLPYGRQQIDDEDVEAVAAVLRGDFLTTGPTVERFEAALAAQLEAPFAVAVSSGTAALHVAMLAAEIGPGDCCIVPSISFVATASAARYVGAEVVFADVDRDSGLMAPEHLTEALERADRIRPAVKPRAVLPVHLAGQTANVERISEIARAQDLLVIEDACHALGTLYDSSSGDSAIVGACRHADMAVFSMHPVKVIAMGEGGAITTAEAEFDRRLRRHRNHGLIREPEGFSRPERAFGQDGTPNPWYYELQEPGYNYRASDIHCALGLSQLAKLDRFIARRRHLVARYTTALSGLSSAVRPIKQTSGCEAAWHLMAVLIDFEALGTSRGEVMRDLKTRGIGTQVHYIPIHSQPYFRDRYGDLDLPGAESYYARTLSLPLFFGMTDQDVDHVVEQLASVLRVN